GVAGVADAFKLGFIPLRSERCILIVRRRDRAHMGVAACVTALRSTAFRRDLSAFGPYDLTRLGESV
ncbi:MAG: substrate-binding domain-containing protein, partial [Vulcanimicrobiaceae bacterium]